MSVAAREISTPIPAATVDAARPASAVSRNAGLDFLRGVAILLVLFAHYPLPGSGIAAVDDMSLTLMQIGGVGVNLFFTLSGFLVGGLLLQEYQRTGTLAPRRFLVRRAFKIWPALYVLVIFHAIVGRHPLNSFFWQNLLHVQNYFGTSISQTWSLAVEEHFYILLALLVWSMVGRSPRVIAATLGAICVASVAARLAIISAGDVDAAFRQTQYRLDSLLYGVLLALLRTFYPSAFQALAAKRAALISAVLVAIAWILLTRNHSALDRGLGYVVQGVGFCAAIVLLHEHGRRLALHGWFRFVAWIGLYSYGIYLWHTLALEPGRRLTGALTNAGLPPTVVWLATLIAQFGAGILMGFVMTKAVEWPFLRLRDRLVPSTPPQPMTTA